MPWLTLRGTTRTLAAIVATAAVVLMPTQGPAEAHHPQTHEFKSGPDHDYGELVDYPLVFPLEGAPPFGDNFNAWRAGNTTHHAIDIMVPRWTPVYAAAAGTVIRINGTGNPNHLPGNCCTLVLRHDDGWRSWYWHLNNDSAHLPPGQCDGKGWGIADGITIGSKVQAGDLIGWVGSSGNATCAYPHLHFELHDPHGVIVNPYWSLKNPAHPFGAAIQWMYDTGLSVGCKQPPGTDFCPWRTLTRAEMATFMRRAIGLSGSQDDGPFVDHLTDEHRTNINAIRLAGLTVGCTETSFCPWRPLTRAEIATFVRRAGNLPGASGTAAYTDITTHWGAPAINAASEAGVAWACNPPANDRFCPDQTVARGEMAQWLYRAWQEGFLPSIASP